MSGQARRKKQEGERRKEEGRQEDKQAKLAVVNVVVKGLVAALGVDLASSEPGRRTRNSVSFVR